MEYLDIVTFRLGIVGWVATLISMLTMFYFCVKMSLDIREDAKQKYRGPIGFPIYIDERDLSCEEGRQAQRLFRRWALVFIVSFMTTGLVMYFHHKYWP